MTDENGAEHAYESTEAGRDVRIEQSKRSHFEELTEDPDSPFHGATLTDTWLFAAAYGSSNVGRESLSGDQHALFNKESMSHQQQWIVKAIAVEAERDGGVLRDEKQVYKIAQEFANTGIEQLYKLYVGPDDAFAELSTEVIKRGREMDPLEAE